MLRDITARLAKSGVIATWCLIFIGVIREHLKEEGQFGAIAVLGLVMLALTLATVALVQAVLGRDVLGARD